MKTYRMIEGMKQEYDNYSVEDFAVWKILLERQMTILPELASNEYLEGIETINFSKDKIPNFIEVNSILGKLTGWEIVVVPGIIAEQDFFKLLSQKKFPATTWLRKMSELDYLPEPDMFHDVFGHIPLLTNQLFCDFFQTLGALGTKYLENENIIAMLGRIYWFTVEFGLINNSGKKKIYGAGILSSHGETKFSLSEVPLHLQFDAEVIMNTHFENDKIQDKYFVIDSFQQLYDSIEIIKNVVEKEVTFVSSRK